MADSIVNSGGKKTIRFEKGGVGAESEWNPGKDSHHKRSGKGHNKVRTDRKCTHSYGHNAG